MSKPIIKSPLKTVALVLIGSAALMLTACAKEKTPTEKATQDAKALATDVKNVAVSTWAKIKDFTFEKKDTFVDGIEHMAKAADEKVSALPEKTADARQKAKQEFNDARAALKSSLADLHEASADTWDAAKEKTVNAWKRVQAAYDKLTADDAS